MGCGGGSNSSQSVSSATKYAFSSQFATQGGSNQATNEPLDLTLDGQGRIYVADYKAGSITKYDASGSILSQIAVNGVNGGKSALPVALTVDGGGDVYVVTTAPTYQVLKFKADGTLLTQFGTNGTGNGQFDAPGAIALDGGGNVYVADSGNSRIQKFTSDGTYVTQFGSAGTGDGKFIRQGLSGIVVGGDGTVYAVDHDLDQVQKFSSGGAFIGRFAVDALNEDISAPGNQKYASPYGIALDGSGNVYVGERGEELVQKLTAQGTPITIIGNNPATMTEQLNGPQSVAVDSNGNLYVLDLDNFRVVIFSATS